MRRDNRAEEIDDIIIHPYPAAQRGNRLSVFVADMALGFLLADGVVIDRLDGSAQ